MKKGLLVGILIGIGLDQFVSRNKWCQKQWNALKEKGGSVLNKDKKPKEDKKDDKPADTEEKE